MLKPFHWSVVHVFALSVTLPSCSLRVAVPESNKNGGCPSTKWPFPSVSFASQTLVPSASPQIGAGRRYVSLKFVRVHIVLLLLACPISTLSWKTAVPDLNSD